MTNSEEVVRMLLEGARENLKRADNLLKRAQREQARLTDERRTDADRDVFVGIHSIIIDSQSALAKLEYVINGYAGEAEE